MIMEEGKKTYNFIKSVKGGCGKTAYSVFLANYIEWIAGDKKCLLIDMDWQGTAMQHLFRGNKDKKVKKYVHQAIESCNNIEDFIVKNEVEGTSIYTMFADPSSSTKARYRVSVAANNYGIETDLRLFEAGFNKLLIKLDEAEDYQHIIFDMPPNFDSYADMAMNCVLAGKPKDSVLEREARVNLFYIMGPDRGHFEATMEDIRYLYQEKNVRNFSNLFIVLNENSYVNSSAEESLDERFSSCKKEIKAMNLAQDDIDKVHFIRMQFHEKYFGYCIEGKTLIEINSIVDKEILPKLPWGNYGKIRDAKISGMIPDNKFLINTL